MQLLRSVESCHSLMHLLFEDAIMYRIKPFQNMKTTAACYSGSLLKTFYQAALIIWRKKLWYFFPPFNSRSNLSPRKKNHSPSKRRWRGVLYIVSKTTLSTTPSTCGNKTFFLKIEHLCSNMFLEPEESLISEMFLTWCSMLVPRIGKLTLPWNHIF